MDFSSLSSSSKQSEKIKQRQIFIIPGNPGVKHYYDLYCAALVESLQSKSDIPFQVITVAHKGHSIKPDISEVYTVQDQIRFHKEYMERFESNSGYPVTLIGHSIGSYIILNMMKDEKFRSKVDKAILLFPTIERMAESPKGRHMIFLLNNSFLRGLLYLFAFICTFLPQIIRLWVAQRVIGRDVDQSMVKVTESITMKPSVIRQVLYMAHTEMLTVNQPDYDLIKKCESRMIAYYGHDDHWVPRSYYNEMVRRFPNAQIYLSPEHMKHDFVLDSSQEMAEITSNWIHQHWINA